MKQPLAAIVGPTAVGKTSLSLEAARMLDGEILSCDSMQIYQDMNIGTAKATQEEQTAAVHHLIDICSPLESFSAADYQRKAYEAIEDVSSRGRLPILVGGTGLFYQAVVDRYDFSPDFKSAGLREKWRILYEEKGRDYIIGQLRQKDPSYLEKIGTNDMKRALHALEVCEAAGKPFSQTMQQKKDTWKLAVIGLYMPREQLYQQINKRVENMVEQGLVEEVEELRRKGLSYHHQSMQAIGYKQVLYYLDGLITKDEMIADIQKESRRYAKRQYTWFKKDSRIFWIHTGSGLDQKRISLIVREYIEKVFAFL